MKKVLKISTVLVLACALILGMSVRVSAAGSKTDLVEITSATKDGQDVKYTADPVPEESDYFKPLTEELASKELAAKNIKNIAAKKLKVLWQKDVTAPSGTTFTFNVTDFNGQPVYAFHWNAQTASGSFVWRWTAMRSITPLCTADRTPKTRSR